MIGAPLWVCALACLALAALIALAVSVHDAYADRRRHRQQYEQQLERWRA